MGERSHNFTTKADLPTIYNDVQNQLTMNPIGVDGFWNLRTSPTYNQMTGTIGYVQRAGGMFSKPQEVSTTINMMIHFKPGSPSGTDIELKYVWHTSQPWNLLGGGIDGPGPQYMDNTVKWIKALCDKYR